MLDPTDITPTVDQVASYVRVRTRDVNGDEVGTFNADTRPTDDEATTIAEQAARYVSLRLGDPKTEWAGDLTVASMDAAAVYAAWRIETSFYTDGSNEETELAGQLSQTFGDQITALVATAQDDQPGANRIYSLKFSTRDCDDDTSTSSRSGLYPSAPRS